MGKQEPMTNGQMVLYTDHTTGLEYVGDIGETTPVSWRPRGDLHFEEWIAIGNTLQQVGASLNWWIGDWLNYGERQWGEMYAQAIEVTGWEYQRLADAKYVSRQLQFSLRNENLKWSHHREVAALDSAEQAAWLERAAVNAWSVRQLREEIRGKAEPVLLVEAEPDEVPFNHVTRWDAPVAERTPVDDYEQQPDEAPALVYPTQPEVLTRTNGNGMAIHYSSDSPEHYTPQVIIDAALVCLGEIDLDPCSNSKDAPNVPARYHYTAADDGLTLPWAGRVYMNPPYGREIGAWVEKLTQSHKTGDVGAAIALVPARTDTQWFAMLRDYPVCFVTGRLTFVGNDDPAPFPSAVFYLGEDVATFYYAFDHLGDIWQRIEPGMFGE